MERYYIYSGRQWVELDIVRGRLAGRSGPVSFLCVQGGTLQEVPREDVLCQLRARAAGRVSRVSCAAPLPSKRRKRRTKCACKYRAFTTLNKKSPVVSPGVAQTVPSSPPTRNSPPRAAHRKQPRAATPDDLSQNEFAARLGLAPSPCRSTPVQAPRRREYEAGEDRALLHWLAEDENRARAVRGVAVWRQLESGVGLMTGTRRTWHSLKNRYLRYLLPTLHSLPLSESQRARLTAGAAPRANPHASILLPRTSKVVSASARAPRPANSPRHLASDSPRPAKSPRHLAPDSPRPAKSSRHPAPDSPRLTKSPRHLAPDSPRPAKSSRHPAPDSPRLTKSPRHPAPDPARPRVTRSSLPRARPLSPLASPSRSRSPSSPRPLRRRRLYNARQNI